MAVELEPTLKPKLQIENWGLIPYQEANARQLQYVDEVAAGVRPETLIFCSHPPVVTLGRATQDSDLIGWSGEMVEVARGGRATYHGPSQLVIYPILNLSRTRDIHAYLRSLEAALIAGLAEFAIRAEARKSDLIGEDGSKLQLTGVWVGEKKLASIGVAIRKWVSYHGVALNCDFDPEAFSGIRPCGFSKNVMTSIEEILKERVSRERLIFIFSKHLSFYLK